VDLFLCSTKKTNKGARRETNWEPEGNPDFSDHPQTTAKTRSWACFGAMKIDPQSG